MTVAPTPPTARTDVPRLFRLTLEVGDLDEAISFYGRLLDLEASGQDGSPAHFECGPVTLVLLEGSSEQPAARLAPPTLSFTVDDLEAVFERAKALECLAAGLVHDEPGGAIVVRPWGERSFYAQDPWENPLCFVEAGTVDQG